MCLLWIIVLQCVIGPAQTQWILVVKWNELLFLTPICFSVFGETAKKTGKIDPYYRNYVDHELYIIIIIIIARCARMRIRPLHCPPNPPPRRVPPLWPHSNSSTLPYLSLFRQSFPKWSLVPLSSFGSLVSTPIP